MKLSHKQLAVFGAVNVNLCFSSATFAKYVPLVEFYKNGWWVTERFGTIVVLVKPRAHKKDGFACRMRHISTTVNWDTLDEQIKLFADAKFKVYKKYLQNSNNQYEWWKDETNLPMLQNRNRSSNVLCTSQERTSPKIPTKQK